MADGCLIAQISDPHIKAEGRLSYRRVDTATALRQAVDKLNRLTPRPDLLIITGDLVDFGQPQEYATLREILSALTLPVYLIPGNHDDRNNLRAAFPDHDYLFQEPQFVQWVVDDYPVRLVGLDSTVLGQPHGQLCRGRLSWLEHALQQQPQRPTVVMLHHHPFISGIAHMDRQNLRSTSALAELISQHPQVERVLCGHLHRSIQARFANTLAVSCPGVSHQVSLDLDPQGSSSFLMEPPGYLLHAWTPETGMMTHQGFITDYDGPYPFFDTYGLID